MIDTLKPSSPSTTPCPKDRLTEGVSGFAISYLNHQSLKRDLLPSFCGFCYAATILQGHLALALVGHSISKP